VRVRLLTPGPVELHPRARLALTRPQLHHRTEEAKGVLMEVRAQMRCAFVTEGEVVALTASGTGAMEAALAGLFRPGERVYVPVAGKFSERWAEIAEAWGLEVYRRDYPWGHALTEADVARDIEDEPIAGALLTHSETSTGVLHPLPALAGAIRSCCPEALVVVDAVTSLFVAPFALDPWGVDAAVTGSQKGLMLPPGLSFVALGPRALSRLAPRGYYTNLAAELAKQRQGEAAFTPAVQLLVAAREVLEVLLADLEGHLERKQRGNDRLYELGLEAGLRPVPEVRSPATAAFYLPPSLSYAALKDAFLRRGAVIAGGQGPLKGRIFRVSLMGYFDEAGEAWAFETVRAVLAEVL